MTTPSNPSDPTSPSVDWRCFMCAVNDEVDYVDPVNPTDTCVACGTMASPCVAFRVELRRVEEQLRSLQAQREQVLAGSPKETAGDVLTPEQAAAFLSLPSTRAVYQAVRRGVIPAHRLGRQLRFSRVELEAVLARR